MLADELLKSLHAAFDGRDLIERSQPLSLSSRHHFGNPRIGDEQDLLSAQLDLSANLRLLPVD